VPLCIKTIMQNSTTETIRTATTTIHVVKSSQEKQKLFHCKTEGIWGVKVQIHSFVTLELEWQSASAPAALSKRKDPPVSTEPFALGRNSLGIQPVPVRTTQSQYGLNIILSVCAVWQPMQQTGNNIPTYTTRLTNSLPKGIKNIPMLVSLWTSIRRNTGWTESNPQPYRQSP